MAITATDGVPQYIQSGDTTRFTFNDADHPTSLWSAILYVWRNSAAVTNFSATESGDTYTVAMTAAQTASLSPGLYEWFIRFTETSSGEIQSGASGTFTVLPNLAATQTASTAATMLSTLETCITSLAAGTNQSVSFNGQSYTKKDIGQLYRLRTQLQAEVHRERAANDALKGVTGRDRYQVRFQNS